MLPQKEPAGCFNLKYCPSEVWLFKERHFPVSVSQQVVVTEEDCITVKGNWAHGQEERKVEEEQSPLVAEARSPLAVIATDARASPHLPQNDGKQSVYVIYVLQHDLDFKNVCCCHHYRTSKAQKEGVC
ncbi:prostaglandin E synthase isoform X1 [Apteryx rowi]|uniref:prostaglandin E synthase isoform X1 n=1 Tax=Apteryx rowi TaxID=308060 RepID=UPI000E1D9D1B|nr:prostaglandin E synthase isoform X1 [Apteryx rowi]